MNCNNPTKGKNSYQGVVLCSHCHSLALMCDQRAVKQVRDLLTIYRESLRVSLASGRLRPSTAIPDPKSKVTEMPKREDLKNVLAGVAQILEKTEKGKAKAGGPDGPNQR
jgi:hypothetical protein